MPKIQPEKLRPYLFHGIDLSWKDGDKEAVGECPFCGKQKFSVRVETGLWQCFTCGGDQEKGGGNILSFVQQLWKVSDEATTKYSALATDRKLLQADTLIHWGIARSITTDNWLVPGYSAIGKLAQLYQYVRFQERSKLLPTPTLGHQLHGVNLYDSKKTTVYLCEGPWDAMAIWEVLGQAKETPQGLALTANRDKSYLADASVLAVPGCMVFFDSWLPLFAEKFCVLMYDNDHPRKHPKTGKEVAPAGLVGMRRVAAILSKAKKPPTKIAYHRWGDGGFTPSLPHGYDIRDCLSQT